MFALSKNIVPTKIFIINRSELEGRIDPVYSLNKKAFVSTFIYPLVKIGSAFIVKDGDHDKLPPKEISDKETGKRYLRAQDLKKNVIIENNPIYISEKYFQKISRCHIYPGDLLLSIMASIGASAIVPSDYPICTANRAVGILRRKENSELLPAYVQALINTEVGMTLFEMEKKGGIQQRLNLSDIANVKLPNPPIAIQQSIIKTYHNGLEIKQKKEAEANTLLNSIDTYLLKELGIALPEKDHSLNKRIFTTQFCEITGGRFDPDYISKYEFLISQKANYPFVPLKELIETSPQYGANEEAIERTSENDIRYIRITDIDELGNLKESGWKTAINTDERYSLNYNDVLFARSGSVGKCYIHKDTTKEAIFAGYLIRFVLDNQKINPDFLFYYCNSSIYKFWISAIERPAVQSNINSEEFKSLPIPLPPFERQNEIVSHIQKIRVNAKQLQEEAKNVLDEAKKKVEQMILGEK